MGSDSLTCVALGRSATLVFILKTKTLNLDECILNFNRIIVYKKNDRFDYDFWPMVGENVYEITVTMLGLLSDEELRTINLADSIGNNNTSADWSHVNFQYLIASIICLIPSLFMCLPDFQIKNIWPNQNKLHVGTNKLHQRITTEIICFIKDPLK